MGLEAENEMDGELAGKDVAHFGACATKCGVEGLVVVALAIVAEHQVDGLLVADGEIAAEARLEVEAVRHLDLIGAETNGRAQINSEEGRNLGGGEIGLDTAVELDHIADIIAGAVI